MRKLTVVGVLTALALAASAGSASATTFDGTCKMAGTVVPTIPYTFIPTNSDAELFADGTCTGTLDGKAYDGPAHLYVDGRMDSPMSCGLLLAKDPPGILTFADDPRRVDATRLDVVASLGLEVLGQLPAVLRGAYNGQAVMHAQVDAGEEEVRACAGDGLHQVGFTMELQTLKQLYG